MTRFATRDLGGGRFALGDAHGDFIEVDEPTQGDFDARRREFERWERRKEQSRHEKWRNRPHPTAVRGECVSAAPAKEAIDTLVERGFTQSEICTLCNMSSKRVSEIKAGKQPRCRQGTVDKLTELLIAAARGDVEPKGRKLRGN